MENTIKIGKVLILQVIKDLITDTSYNSYTNQAKSKGYIDTQNYILQHFDEPVFALCIQADMLKYKHAFSDKLDIYQTLVVNYHNKLTDLVDETYIKIKE